MMGELENIQVGVLMSKELVSLTYDMTVGEATQYLTEQRVHGAPVVGRDGFVLGVLSATDILEAVGDKLFTDDFEDIERIRELRETGIGPLISAGALTCTQHTTVAEACEQLADERVHRLVVVSSEGYPVGIFSPSDVVRAIAGKRLG